MTASETELVKKVKRKRDMVAFRDLVLAYQKRIYYLIRRIVYSHEDAEDLVQETFIRSLRFIDNIRDESRFGSWISRIAVNLALEHKQKKYTKGHVSIDCNVPPEVISEKFTDTEGGERPLRKLREEEIRTRIDDALMKLPENHRKAFVLYHYNSLAGMEIAEIMDCPDSTVRTYIFRAVKQLREELKDYYQLHKE